MRKQRLREITQLVQAHIPRAVYKSPVCPSTYTLHRADHMSDGEDHISIPPFPLLSSGFQEPLPSLIPQTGDDYGYRTL